MEMMTINGILEVRVAVEDIDGVNNKSRSVLHLCRVVFPDGSSFQCYATSRAAASYQIGGIAEFVQ